MGFDEEGRVGDCGHGEYVLFSFSFSAAFSGRRSRVGEADVLGSEVLILSSLRYSSYKLHAREQAKKVAASSSSSSSSYSSTGSGNGGSFTVPSREAGTQTSDDMSPSTGSGVDPSLVSLG